jgi:hypothetical protein
MLQPRIWIVPNFSQGVCELVHTCTRGGAVNLKRSRCEYKNGGNAGCTAVVVDNRAELWRCVALRQRLPHLVCDPWLDRQSPRGFRTIQDCPKDLPATLRHAELRNGVAESATTGSSLDREISAIHVPPHDAANLPGIKPRAAYGQLRSSNANGLRSPVVAPAAGIIARSQMHGSRSDI